MTSQDVGWLEPIRSNQAAPGNQPLVTALTAFIHNKVPLAAKSKVVDEFVQFCQSHWISSKTPHLHFSSVILSRGFCPWFSTDTPT